MDNDNNESGFELSLFAKIALVALGMFIVYNTVSNTLNGKQVQCAMETYNVQVEEMMDEAYSFDEIDQMLSKLEEAVAYTDEGSFLYYLILGEIAYYNDEMIASKEYYVKAIEIEPNDCRIAYSMGYQYIYEEDFESALKLLNTVIDTQLIDNADKADVWNGVGVSYVGIGDYKNAVDSLLKSNYQDNKDIRYVLGMSYLNIENVIQARVHLQKARELGYELDPELDWVFE